MGKRTKDNVERADWTTEKSNALVKSIRKFFPRGLVGDNGLKKTEWSGVAKLFNEQTQCNYDKSILQNHLSQLKKRYTIFGELIAKSGFGWDSVENTVTAEDDVWEALISNRSAADISHIRYRTIRYIRRFGFGMYDDLHKIFDKCVAKGKYSINTSMTAEIDQNVVAADSDEQSIAKYSDNNSEHGFSGYESNSQDGSASISDDNTRKQKKSSKPTLKPKPHNKSAMVNPKSNRSPKKTPSKNESFELPITPPRKKATGRLSIPESIKYLADAQIKVQEQKGRSS